ncbi:hypothetical protein KKC06_00150 [Patescibacteria group bacterium]|nr:hypothetical protein [Patescibacteria group bacterium]
MIKKSTLFFTVFSILFVLLCFYSFFIDLYPQKSNTDLWTHLAIINELKVNDYSEVNAPFFTDGENDPRSGIYLTGIALVSKIFNISTINTYLFFGIINIIFFLICSFLFSKHFLKSKYNYLFPLLLIFLWGPSRNIYAGMFSLNEILWIGPFYHFFTFSLLLLSLIYADKLIEQKRSVSSYLLVIIPVFVLYNTHMLTGIIFFVALYALITAKIINYKKITRELIFLFSIPFLCFLLNFLWPLYDQWNYFFNRGAVNAIQDVNNSETYRGLDYYWKYINSWILVGGLSLLGIIFSPKNKKYFTFIILLFIITLIIIFSGLTPWPIQFYWRFFPLIVLAGVMGWMSLFQIINKRLIFILIALIIIIGLLFTMNKMVVFKDWEPYTYQQSQYQSESISYDILNNISKKSVVFTDEVESHILSGLTGLNVVGVRPSHAGFNQTDIQNQGYDNIKAAYEEPEKIDELIPKYQITHILLKRKISEKNFLLSQYVNNKYRLIDISDDFYLYYVGNDL